LITIKLLKCIAGDDVANDAFPVAREVDDVVRGSAGSVHSSGSSSTSMSTQRIVVN